MKRKYITNVKKIEKIPGKPLAYWVSEEFLEKYSNKSLLSEFDFKRGIATGENSLFLRFWHEINYMKSSLYAEESAKWYPYNKGGEFRKWYGNREYFVNWENDGHEICNFKNSSGKLASRPQNVDYNFLPNISYSSLTSGPLSFREYIGFINDQAGNYFVASKTYDRYVALALLNSCVSQYCINLKNVTLNTTADDFLSIPLIKFEKEKSVGDYARSCIDICRSDWDSYEESWDFIRHPLIEEDSHMSGLIEEKYNNVAPKKRTS